MSEIYDFDIINNLPEVLPTIAITHPRVLYPFVSERYVCKTEDPAQVPHLMEDIRACGNLAVFVPTKPGTQFPYRSEDLYSVGVVAQISDMEQTEEGTFRFLARGLERMDIVMLTQEKPYFKAQISYNGPLPDFFDEEAKQLHRDVITSAKRLYAIIEHTSEEEALKNLLEYLQSRTDKGSFILAYLLQTTASADWSAWKGKHILQMDAALRLQFLTCDSDKERLTLLKHFLDREVPLFEAENRQTNDKTNQKTEFKAVPNSEKNIPRDFETSLGKDIKTGKDIWIDQNARRSGMLILGSTGYGKSGLINHMVASDMRQVVRRKGGREEKIGICVIAPDGDLIDGIIGRIPREREEDVILLDPTALSKRDAYFGINLFACPNPSDLVQFELAVEQVISVFEKLFTMSETTPMLLDYVQAITRTFVGTQYTMLEVSSLLRDDAFRKRVVDPDSDFWDEYNSMRPQERREEYRSTIRRVRNLTDNKILRYIIGQSTMFDFEEAINENKILLINLDGEYKHLGKLLGGIIIAQMLLVLLQRKNTPRSERSFFNLYIDEFQNYVSPTINKMATECRKYGLALTVAHQSSDQEGITNEIRATTRQVGSKIFFKLSNIDGPQVANVFDTTPPAAVKPEPTVPRNILEYLNRHPHEAVKQFSGTYVARLEAALGKRESYERDYASGVKYEIPPDHNFGEGVVSYDRDDVQESLFLLNDLLYEAQTAETINEGKKGTLLALMAALLNFVDYYHFAYLHDTARFEPVADHVRWSRLALADYQQIRDRLIAFRESDIDIMRFHLFRGKTLGDCEYEEKYGHRYIGYKYHFNKSYHWDEGESEFSKRLREYKAMPEDKVRRQFLTLAQEYAVLAKRSESLQTYVSSYREEYKQLLEKQTGGLHRYSLEYVKNDRWNKNWLSWWQQYRWDYQREYQEGMLTRVQLGGGYHCQGRFNIVASIAEWLEALESNEAFVNLLATHAGYFVTQPIYHRIEHPTPERIWEAFTDERNLLYAYYGPRDTYEKLLAQTRQELEQEISEFEEHVQKKRQRYDATLSQEQQQLDEKKRTQKARHDRFVTALDAVLTTLQTPGGRIPVPSTQWQETIVSQQNFSDREREIANQLTHLAARQAMISIPTGEYTMTTHDIPGVPDITKKKERILENTIRRYCKSRSQVEQEIAERTRLGSQPQTSRKHTLEQSMR